MSFRTSSFAILVAIAAITLALVTAASFTHYSAFAVSKKDDSTTTTTKGTSTTSAATNSNSLTSKELKSFINCVTTANKAQGLTHKVVRSCLDTALGIPAASSAGTAAAAAAAAGAGASSAGSSTSDTTG
jgi:hypothetical protein